MIAGITDPQGMILALFAAFCRIGACLMVIPGFSTARVPVQVRLLTAVAVSMAILPLMWSEIYPKVSVGNSAYIYLIGSETIIGAAIGLVARFYFLGLQFVGTVLSLMIGFTAPPMQDVLEDSTENQLTNLITYAGLIMLYMLDFHHIMFEAVVQSYTALPMSTGFDPQNLLVSLTNSLSTTFLIMLKLSSPFILYGILFNTAVGMVNKLAPAIPIAFISTPYLILGGLFLTYLGIAAMLRIFADSFAQVMQAI
ncbi:flagellar biosynthetic protein FliR [Rhizobium sp. RU20A]|uniref:flagellar biosynthetic protein FliR n=1 Tax=Rhizobium sp. RU20A TaxID=1907412 RepID=UPI0009550CEB|nr:flagellar biosynthetic protein FliR [Rhizobium sp. RU20A]SIQ55200.1 flagellar biosynthetic protein FliR [Rhizobium sp. RU20A]